MRRIVIATFICFLFAASLGADCPSVFYPDDPPCVPSATYYTSLFDEPNWCNYSIGDTIYIHVGTGGVINQWYVVPYGDSTTQPPSGFATAYWGVVGESCSITWYIRV